MSSLNDQRGRGRRVTQSHYTRPKRKQQDANAGFAKKKKTKSRSTRRDKTLDEKSGESVKRKGVKHTAINSYLANHLWALVSTLGNLYRTPVSTLMTTIVIGIALALPVGLYLVLQNVQYLSSNWDHGTQISLFLHQDVNDKQAQILATELRKYSEVENVDFISADSALEEFRTKSGFKDALNMLDENPLPTVLVVSLEDTSPTKAEITRLMKDLADQEHVDMAQLDMQWLERLNGIINIGQRSAFIVAMLLGVAIFIIVSNTIRLTIQNRRQEIEVTKLIGGTDSFIQRPFLYGGIWYGVIGSLIAMLLVYTSLGLLETPVNNLAGLYNSDFQLLGLGFGEGIAVIFIGVLLSWLGSWFSVYRHLREIEPK